MAVVPEVGDILKLTVKGAYDLVQETNNVFYFHVDDVTPTTGDPATVEEFAHGLWRTYRNEFAQNLAGNAMTWAMVKGEILDTDTGLFIAAEDFIVPTDEQDIHVAGDTFPPANSCQLRLNRASGSFRHGYKRLPGIAESAAENGLLTDGNYAVLTAFAVALLATIVPYTYVSSVETARAGAGMTIRIIQSTLDGDILPVPVFEFPSAIVPNRRIVTQNSRKFGVGS